MAESVLGDDPTLKEAKDWLRENVRTGARCPCCNQLAKVYKRPINSGMAVSLIRMFRAAGTDWQHIPTTIGGRSREEGKLRYWDLVLEELTERPDGGRAGWWRVTPRGSEFVLGRLFVPKYAYIYDGKCLRIDGPRTDIHHALGDKFDYRELMNG